MGYVYYVSNPRKPSLAQLVERGTVVKTAVIPGSPVQFRNGGLIMFFFLLGKFAQRSNLIKTEMVTEPKELFDLLYSSEFEVTDARLVNDETVEVHYRNVGEFEEQNNKVNIVIAAFTTAYARLKLYDLLARPFTRTGSLLRYGFGGLRARTR